MLTIFCSPKPFVGVAEWNQLNAFRSWRSIHPSVEILIFGAVSGAIVGVGSVVAREVRSNVIPVGNSDRVMAAAPRNTVCHDESSI